MGNNFAILGAVDGGMSTLYDRKKKEWEAEDEKKRRLALENEDRARAKEVQAQQDAMFKHNQDLWAQQEEDRAKMLRKEAQNESAQVGVKQLEARQQLVRESLATASPAQRSAVLDKYRKMWADNGWGEFSIVKVEPVDDYYAKVVEADYEEPDGEAVYYHSLHGKTGADAVNYHAFSEEQRQEITKKIKAAEGLKGEKDQAAIQEKKATVLSKQMGAMETSRKAIEKRIEKIASQFNDELSGEKISGSTGLRQKIAKTQNLLMEEKDSAKVKEYGDQLSIMRDALQKIQEEESRLDKLDAEHETVNQKYMKLIGGEDNAGVPEDPSQVQETPAGNAALQTDPEQPSADPVQPAAEPVPPAANPISLEEAKRLSGQNTGGAITNPDDTSLYGNLAVAGGPTQATAAAGNQAKPQKAVASPIFIFKTADGKAVILPKIDENGKQLSDEEAIAQYKKTGKNFGQFNSVEEAKAKTRRVLTKPASSSPLQFRQQSMFNKQSSQGGNTPVFDWSK